MSNYDNEVKALVEANTALLNKMAADGLVAEDVWELQGPPTDDPSLLEFEVGNTIDFDLFPSGGQLFNTASSGSAPNGLFWMAEQSIACPNRAKVNNTSDKTLALIGKSTWNVAVIYECASNGMVLNKTQGSQSGSKITIKKANMQTRYVLFASDTREVTVRQWD